MDQENYINRYYWYMIKIVSFSPELFNIFLQVTGIIFFQNQSDNFKTYLKKKKKYTKANGLEGSFPWILRASYHFISHWWRYSSASQRPRYLRKLRLKWNIRNERLFCVFLMQKIRQFLPFTTSTYKNK